MELNIRRRQELIWPRQSVRDRVQDFCRWIHILRWVAANDRPDFAADRRRSSLNLKS